MHEKCIIPVGRYPSCLHTTCASAAPQKSSHTVPHCESMHISTLPCNGVVPPTSLNAVLTMHYTFNVAWCCRANLRVYTHVTCFSVVCITVCKTYFVHSNSKQVVVCIIIAKRDEVSKALHAARTLSLKCTSKSYSHDCTIRRGSSRLVIAALNKVKTAKAVA